jgi:carboxyl-terminal processing protease
MSKNNRRNRKKVMWWLVGIVVLVIVGGVIGGRRWLLSSENDFRELSWTAAFDQLHEHLVTHYPFTDWKAIDWDVLYAQTAPRIAAAEAANDLEAYYLALREYAYAIPDGHVALAGDDFGLRQQAIGGGYGLGIIGLDDGRVIAHILLDDGPAAKAGMEWGAEVLSWNGQPIAEAVAQTETLWAEIPQATQEGHLLEQYRYLVRDPIGTETRVTFQNPDAATQTVTLVAEADDFEALNRTLPPAPDPLAKVFTNPVQPSILPSGYGYLEISGFMPSLGGLRMAKNLDRAIELFVTEDVPGIIIDVRGNEGGLDALVPQLVGHFYDAPDFYEQIAYYDPATGQFQINPAETLPIEPQQPYYGGPVIVLVDKSTASTAEGPPLAVQRLPQGQVVGVYGTNGSFAMGTPGQDLYRLPEGVAFNFLAGRALDANERILVDGDAHGMGGVVPDVRVPLTEETVYAMFVEGRDVVLETAVSTLNEMPEPSK